MNEDDKQCRQMYDHLFTVHYYWDRRFTAFRKGFEFTNFTDESIVSIMSFSPGEYAAKIRTLRPNKVLYPMFPLISKAWSICL